METVGVTIIDRGVHIPHLAPGVVIVRDDVVGDEDIAFEVARQYLAHGTNIANIIARLAPNARLMSMTLRTSAAKVPLSLLVDALWCCAEQQDVQIINISMGIVTEQVNPELEAACRACYDAGKLIVAAAHLSADQPCYPAAFPFVYGVGSGLSRQLDAFMFLGDGYINVLAKGIHQRMWSEQFEPVIRDGTSYATAAFTGIMARLLQDQPNVDDLSMRQWLRQNSVSMLSMHDLSAVSQPVYIAPSALPPRTLAHPPHDAGVQQLVSRPEVAMIMQCPLDPAGNYNQLAAAAVGKRTLPGVLSDKLCDHVDALVLGNFLRNQYTVNIYFGYALIDLFIRHDKDFVVWDDYIYHMIVQRTATTNFAGTIHRAGAARSY